MSHSITQPSVGTWSFKEINCKMIPFNLLPLWGPEGWHGLPKASQLGNKRARPQFRSPLVKNGVVLNALQKSTMYVQYIKPTKHQIESSQPCGSFKSMRSWFMPLLCSWRIIFRRPSSGGQSHAYHHGLAWHPSTHSCACWMMASTFKQWLIILNVTGLGTTWKGRKEG